MVSQGRFQCCYSICCLIFSISPVVSALSSPSLKTPRITMLRYLQLLCCRTPELPTNGLFFLLMPSGCKVRAKLPFFTIQAVSNRIIHYQPLLTTSWRVHSRHRQVLMSRSVCCSVIQMRLFHWMLPAVFLHLHSISPV